MAVACAQDAQKAAPAAVTPSPSAVAKAPGAADGKQLFVNNCAKCHGLTGLGDGPSAGSLRTQAGLNLTVLQSKSDEEILNTIAQGKGTEMPPWELVLSPEERQAVLQHVRTLAR